MKRILYLALLGLTCAVSPLHSQKPHEQLQNYLNAGQLSAAVALYNSKEGSTPANRRLMDEVLRRSKYGSIGGVQSAARPAPTRVPTRAVPTPRPAPKPVAPVPTPALVPTPPQGPAPLTTADRAAIQELNDAVDRALANARTISLKTLDNQVRELTRRLSELTITLEDANRSTDDLDPISEKIEALNDIYEEREEEAPIVRPAPTPIPTTTGIAPQPRPGTGVIRPTAPTIPTKGVIQPQPAPTRPTPTTAVVVTSEQMVKEVDQLKQDLHKATQLTPRLQQHLAEFRQTYANLSDFAKYNAQLTTLEAKFKKRTPPQPLPQRPAPSRPQPAPAPVQPTPPPAPQRRPSVALPNTPQEARARYDALKTQLDAADTLGAAAKQSLIGESKRFIGHIRTNNLGIKPDEIQVFESAIELAE